MNKYELPNGTIQTVTSQNEDIWFGLRVSHTRYLQAFVLRAKILLRAALTTLYT
jgi:hypothetical protein